MLMELSILALAYETLSHKISASKTFVPSSDFGSTSVTHMSNAVGKWNTAIGSTKMQISSTTHNTTGYYKDDGKNYVYKEDAGTDYVGECRYWWNSSGNLTQADININPYYSWANSAQPNCYDLYSIFLHETGHAAGLADLYASSDSAAVMYGYASVNSTKRSLAQDDKDGIAAIY
jgi:hypothetical protein